jgi:hypothetical protein
MALTREDAKALLPQIAVETGSNALALLLKEMIHDGNLAVVGVDATISEIDGALDGVLATAAEINRVADVSTRVVTLVASGALDVATHGDKILNLGEVGGNALCAMTLPAATGSGTRFDLWVSVLNTSTYTITCDGTDEFRGSIKTHDNDSTAATAYAAISGDNILTLNGGTTGGAVGDHITLVDALTGFWFVDGNLVVPIGSNIADPFS